ncbi:hypothetical protein Prudu_187S000100 [Prunus dulcis]|uniref:Uncharacterized protein n=1 Tax=Prunus dulcis TaxID=3755 RepID=A0A5H2XKY1_PRUDU|nr:hypothetical protein Prudu_187S000100 [Prunus dulcis]
MLGLIPKDLEPLIGCNLRVENSMFSNSSFRPQVTSGMQKMAAVGECTAEGNWYKEKTPIDCLRNLSC